MSTQRMAAVPLQIHSQASDGKRTWPEAVELVNSDRCQMQALGKARAVHRLWVSERVAQFRVAQNRRET